jgi:hydroxypyruvate reductase
MIARERCEAAFAAAVAACDPAARVAAALAEPALAARVADRRVLGLAFGKAALAMARGAGPVAEGIAVTVADDGKPLPAGWRLALATHPEPGARSERAAQAAAALIATGRASDVVLALISGGASALVERFRGAIRRHEHRAVLRKVTAQGVAIRELNVVRAALSGVKMGQLVVHSRAPVVTLAASDVIGDDLDVIGSGPTVGPWLARPGEAVDAGAWDAGRRAEAAAILARCGVEPRGHVADVLYAPRRELLVARHDVARVVAPMSSFGEAVAAALGAAGVAVRRMAEPFAGDVAEVADRLAREPGAIVGWGEPTVRVPADHGAGGRAQQLALALAQRLRDSDRSAFVAGSDGCDGPPQATRPTPAGGYIDGSTWDAIAAAGLDPSAALARRDASPALAAASALVTTGPTGVNHADVVIVG